MYTIIYGFCYIIPKIIKTESTGAKGTVGVNIGSGGAGGKRVSWRERVN